MKTSTKGFLIGMAIVLLAGSSAWASGKGTSAVPFLRLGVSARAAGMAEAYGPIADDATAIHYNPAGLQNNKKRDVSLSYNAYFEDTASQFVGYAQPTEKLGTFGVGITMFNVKDIESRSTAGDTDAPQGTFDTKDLAVSLGWANKVGLGSTNLNYGFALKYISSDLNTATGKTAALDGGVQWSVREDGGFTAAFSVLNLGGDISYDEESDPLPLTLKPGVAYKMATGRAGTLTGVIDSDILVYDNKAYVSPGVEWVVHPVLALRSGYQFGRDEGAGSGFSAGLGFKFAGMGLDYAFVPYGDLGNTHRISLDFKF